MASDSGASKTVVGGCFCGKIRVEYSGQPITVGLCHCSDCRKLSGGPFTYSFVVKSADFKVTGSPKAVAKTADSGNNVKNYFCPDCGTPLYGMGIGGSSEATDEVMVVRAGIFDDLEVLNRYKPEGELFIHGRAGWVGQLEGTTQFEGMPPNLS